MPPPLRFTAQFDDIELRLEYVNDTIGMSYAEYEYPDTNGSEFGDLGQRARTFDCRAWFINEDYLNYEAFEAALTTLKTVHNFVHPTRGLLVGIVPTCNIRHDSRRKTAIVDFQFREQLQGDVEDRLTPLITPKIEEAFAAGQQNAVASLRVKIMAAIGPEGAQVVARVTNSATDLVSQFITATSAARSYVAKIDTALGEIDSFMSNVAQPAGSLIATIEYGSTLPERMIGSIAQAVDRYVTLAETATDSPYTIMQSFYNGMLKLQQSATGFESEVVYQMAMGGALLVAKLFKTDDENRGQADAIAQVSPWTANGEYVGKPQAPQVMTIDDLERTVSVARKWIQSAIDLDRGNSALHEMAAALLRHVNVIKIDRERVVEIDVPAEIPLLLLCHARGLGYGAAERVLSINPTIQNTNACVGAVQIYE